VVNETTSTGARAVLSLDLVPGREADFNAWYSRMVALAKEFAGLVEVQLIEPVSGVQNQWTLILTFDSISRLRALLNDGRYRGITADAEAATGAVLDQQVVPDVRPVTVPVTVVVSQLLKPGVESAYEKWQLKVDEAARKFPVFLGTELLRPVAGVQDEWVVIFRFDSAKHLDDWFASDVYVELKKEAEAFYKSVQVRRIGRGFEDWFANAAGDTATGIPQWKMAMVVLLTLFPTVMLLSMFVTPLMGSLPLPLAVFISNIISVGLLTWVIMPVATRALRRWLESEQIGQTVLGAAMICVIYAILVVAFIAARS
jgi:antibiotic biosynthesis monooxygenase (ABM) superfamily enzyme